MKFHAEIDGYRIQYRDSGAWLSARVWPEDGMLALPFMPIATVAEGRSVLEGRVQWLVGAHRRKVLAGANAAREAVPEPPRTGPCVGHLIKG